MLEHGVGLTVIPRHCVADLLGRKTLWERRLRRRKPLLNNIYIVTLSGVEQPRRVQAVMNAFWEMKP